MIRAGTPSDKKEMVPEQPATDITLLSGAIIATSDETVPGQRMRHDDKQGRYSDDNVDGTADRRRVR